MTIAFKVGIGDLITEFLSHTEILRRLLQAAGTVPVLAQQPLPDLLYYLRIIIKTDFHGTSPL